MRKIVGVLLICLAIVVMPSAQAADPVTRTAPFDAGITCTTLWDGGGLAQWVFNYTPPNGCWSDPAPPSYFDAGCGPIPQDPPYLYTSQDKVTGCNYRMLAWRMNKLAVIARDGRLVVGRADDGVTRMASRVNVDVTGPGVLDYSGVIQYAGLTSPNVNTSRVCLETFTSWGQYLGGKCYLELDQRGPFSASLRVNNAQTIFIEASVYTDHVSVDNGVAAAVVQEISYSFDPD